MSPPYPRQMATNAGSTLIPGETHYTVARRTDIVWTPIAPSSLYAGIPGLKDK